jgi:ubiquinone/menaquinone biosynthesis C-methylase UbiE
VPLEGVGGADHFAGLAARYDELRPADDAWVEVLEALIRLGRLDYGRVLDVGCGTGQAAEALAARGARVWGVDPSSAMLERARERHLPGGGVKQARAERLPFKPGWFDGVLMRQVVQHVDRPAAFAEAFRVLRPGGRLAIATFHPDHLHEVWISRLVPRVAELDEGRFPPQEVLEAELRAAGFAQPVVERLRQTRPISREAAVERLRGRFISTLSLVTDDELAEGIARAERDLPERFDATLDWLLLAAERPGA